jgi:excisionase family DNA binding protein
METPLPPRLLNPRQLSKVLNLSVGHCYRLVQERKIPFVRLGGSIRFRSEAIDDWIRRQEVATVGQVLRGKVWSR